MNSYNHPSAICEAYQDWEVAIYVQIRPWWNVSKPTIFKFDKLVYEQLYLTEPPWLNVNIPAIIPQMKAMNPLKGQKIFFEKEIVLCNLNKVDKSVYEQLYLTVPPMVNCK